MVKSKRGFDRLHANQLIMQEFGPPSEDLALAILKQPVNKEQPAAHLGMALVLRDVGGRKSLAALKSLAARRGIPDSINADARDAAAHIEQRLKQDR